MAPGRLRATTQPPNPAAGHPGPEHPGPRGQALHQAVELGRRDVEVGGQAPVALGHQVPGVGQVAGGQGGGEVADPGALGDHVAGPAAQPRVAAARQVALVGLPQRTPDEAGGRLALGHPVGVVRVVAASGADPNRPPRSRRRRAPGRGRVSRVAKSMRRAWPRRPPAQTRGSIAPTGIADPVLRRLAQPGDVLGRPAGPEDLGQGHRQGGARRQAGAEGQGRVDGQRAARTRPASATMAPINRAQGGSSDPMVAASDARSPGTTTVPSKAVEVTVRSRRFERGELDGHAEPDGHGEGQAPVVVGVVADQVDPTRSAARRIGGTGPRHYRVRDHRWRGTIWPCPPVR